ncbi:hypothetical protein BABINDRAFT_5792 [Babjeviella inositovora NRRL Y-12698]|uniref:Uncharacterized protein n=1 Tax=Babjeviella inositovora NRRL Y-12698 TaxID=984486 RepID=A0A1E3QZ47_9ASCO|nr:uncharacterized protein BABINDRAFT_5792 [Babjeviella inositovora NRRL Y-12698]ODQ82895.1 hypothetical protein BABINDRAFT_5792 [Babjeviella inositovora NRRL Y-12698]
MKRPPKPETEKKSEEEAAEVAKEVEAPAPVVAAEAIAEEAVTQEEPLHVQRARQILDANPPLSYIDTQAAYNQLISVGFTPAQATEVLEHIETILNEHFFRLLTEKAHHQELVDLEQSLVSRLMEMKMDMDRRRDQFKTRFVQEMEIYKTHLMQQDSQSHLMVMEHISDSQVALTDIRIANDLKTEERQEKIHTINSRVSTNIALSLKGDVADLRWDLIKRGLFFIALIFMAGIVGHREFQKIKHKQAEDEKKKLMMPTPMLKVHEPTEMYEEDFGTNGDDEYRKYGSEYS